MLVCDETRTSAVDARGLNDPESGGMNGHRCIGYPTGVMGNRGYDPRSMALHDQLSTITRDTRRMRLMAHELHARLTGQSIPSDPAMEVDASDGGLVDVVGRIGPNVRETIDLLQSALGVIGPDAEIDAAPPHGYARGGIVQTHPITMI